MNVKSKIFGFAAASIFALSITTGAMAQSADGVAGTATLVKGVCSVAIDQGQVDLGSWTYNGHDYVLATGAGSNVAYLSGEVKEGRPGGGCNVTVQFGGLSGESGTIGAENFSVGANGTNWLGLDTNAAASLKAGVTTNVPAIQGNGYVMLEEVPEDFQPGAYTGTLNVTINATN